MEFTESRLEAQARLDALEMNKAYNRLGRSIGVDIDPGAHSLDSEQANRAICQCLKYYGITPGSVPEGDISLNDRISYLCRPSGTMVREVVLEEKWYKNSCGAMLGKLDSGDLIALTPRGVNGYGYLDPVTDKFIHVDKKCAKRIKSEAWLFYKPFRSSPMNTTDLVAYMAGTIERRDLNALVLAAVASCIVGLVPAIIYKIAYGIVIPSGETRWIFPLVALFLGVSIAGLLFSACRELVFCRISQKMKVWTEAASFSRMLLLPTSFFEKFNPGNIATRISQIPIMAEQLSMVCFEAGLTLLLAFVYMIQIFYICAPLAAVSFAVFTVQIILILVAIRVTLPYEKAAVNEQTKMAGFVSTELEGIQKIKLAGAEKRFFSKWSEYYASYAAVRYRRPAIIRALPELVTIIGTLGMVVMYYLSVREGLAADSYMAFSTAYGLITAATFETANMAVQFVKIAPLLEVIQPIIREQPEVGGDKLFVDKTSGEVKLQNVWFRYNKDMPYLLKGITFSIRQGEYVAIVGRSGCGKSTLVKLILGFELPERGVINIGQFDTSKVDMNSLRRTMISIVLQDSALYSGTIESNITIANPNATVEDAWEAARLAEIDEEIKSWEMGMHSLVSDGEGSFSTLSGGQKQRILIARAICGKKSLLILDEATSALDNNTQKKVVDSLSKLNCTKLVIAHRLSTVRECDRILVLDDGVIAEEGTYDELIEKNGIFAELVARQRLED